MTTVAIPDRQDVTIFFIVDGLKLELQSIFLICSIKKHFGNSLKVIAYHRQDYEVTAYTRDILESQGARLVAIPRTFSKDVDPWPEPWPVGNKLLAIAEPRDTKISAFLDTDMVFVNHVDFEAELDGGEVLACTADFILGGLDHPKKWEPVYAFFDMPMPETRRRLLRGRRVLIPPYYNAGLAVFREGPVGDAQVPFGQAWLHHAARAKRSGEFEAQSRNVDQVTYPVTIERIGARFTLGRHGLNYNAYAHPYDGVPDIAIPHYHHFSTFLRHRPNLALDIFRSVEEAMGTEALRHFIQKHKGPLDWYRSAFDITRTIDSMLENEGTLLTPTPAHVNHS